MTAKKKINEKALDVSITPSCGNVFADIGLPNPEILLMKADLTIHIRRLLQSRDVTPSQAAKLLGIHPSQVSMLMRNSSGNFSVERLLELLTKLGQNVFVTVTPRRDAVSNP